MARQRAKRKAEEEAKKIADFNSRVGAFTAKSAAARAHRAAIVIQRAYRRWKARKNEVERLKRRNEGRRRRDSDEKLDPAFQLRQLRAAKVLQRNWRRWKQRKAEGFVDGGSKAFLASPEDPFLKNLINKGRNRIKMSTVGIRNYHEEKWCGICVEANRKVGKRECANCAGTIFCEACFVESHDKGSRRRHVYLRITYDKDLPEGQTGDPSRSLRSTQSLQS